jgi:hypothetical protein
MPDQFWGLTVREFWIKVRGFVRAENRALWLVAEGALLHNGPEHWKSKPRTADRLLGYSRPMVRYPVKPWLPKPS